MNKITLGVDLGTTNSAAFYLNDQNIPINILTEEGKKSMPSIVSFASGGQVQVGEVARRQLAINKDTVTKIKSFMGRNHNVSFGGNNYSPEQISALILMKIKQLAENQTSSPIQDAVITVPAYFSNIQREKTQIAAKIAGLNPIAIINEPTSAALSIQFQNTNILPANKNNKILVYDFGGGTFDVSILNNYNKDFKVIGTGGDKQLGGDNVDMQILNLIIRELSISNNVEININNPQNAFVVRKLLFEIEEMKKMFSNKDSVNLSFPSLSFVESSKPLGYSKTFTKQEFSSYISPVVGRTIKIINNMFEELNMTAQQVDYVFLVGGSCKLELVNQEIEKIFTPQKVIKSLDLDLSVSMGAAVYSSLLTGNLQDGTKITDVTSISIGIVNAKGLVVKVVPKNTTIPFMKEIEFHTSQDNQKEVKIKIVEGENKLEKYCEPIGNFTLNNLTPLPKGINNIVLILNIDKNGIINIKAIEKNSSNNNSKEITITKKVSDISEDQIQKLSIITHDEEEDNIILLDRFSKIIDTYNKQLISLKKSDDKKLEDTILKKINKYHKLQNSTSIDNKKNIKKIKNIVDNFNKNLLKVKK